MRSSRTMKRAPQRSKPELSESWGVVDDDEDGDFSNGNGESADDEEDGNVQSYQQTQRSFRVTRSSVEPESMLNRPLNSRRRSARLSSGTNSAEPELIMPSLHSMEDSFSPRPPQASSIRSRKTKSPTHTTQPAAKRNPRTKRRVDTNSDQSSTPGIVWDQVIAPVVGYLMGIFGHALVHLKPVFGAFLAVFLLIQLARLAFKIPFSFNPLGALNITPMNFIPSPCSIPIVSTLMPFCEAPSPQFAQPVEFDELVTVQAQFEDVLDSAVQGSLLPVDMKRSEAAVRDLKHVVKYSNLPSRESLLFEFQNFIELARTTSDDLTKFNSRIGRAVDQIINVNRHTLQVIDGFKESDASRGAISRFFFGSVGLTDQNLLNQYLKHTSQVEDQILNLITEAEALKRLLDILDDHLDAIQDIVTRDGVNLQNSKDKLLSELWGKLGGHRNEVSKKDEQLGLLNSVNIYRRQAWAHVTTTIVKLQAIEAGLVDLRERVAGPEVLGLEMVPLEQHISIIQMGVERLESTRNSAREIEVSKMRSLATEGRILRNERLVGGR
ncbi:hypothetical protein E2P81_ATG01067 [Venturia nashicola]|uniref:Uncharacterized protein n=1 Tax=Venturia nashicola TaxID=86259 RepID=A0A4Z1PR25_9PEZI|nr:hypothetical protein E6O75_ATG01088 [Venturia nashicola]TLD38524.1 hypothetical protein E2P81_ATG01067 [Venturia nashicola]